MTNPPAIQKLLDFHRREETAANMADETDVMFFHKAMIELIESLWGAVESAPEVPTGIDVSMSSPECL